MELIVFASVLLVLVLAQGAFALACYRGAQRDVALREQLIAAAVRGSNVRIRYVATWPCADRHATQDEAPRVLALALNQRMYADAGARAAYRRVWGVAWEALPCADGHAYFPSSPEALGATRS